MPKAHNNSEELYIYPALFTEMDSQVGVEFPDIPGCFTCGKDCKEAVMKAKEVLALTLFGMEEDNEKLPEPIELCKIKPEQGQYVLAIDVWMPYYRAKIKTCYVKKTLTIPNWLNAIAEYNNVNFSQVLRTALIDYLGIQERD